jgi:hypothetical protein
LLQRFVLFGGCRKTLPSLLDSGLKVVHVGSRILRDRGPVAVVVGPRPHEVQKCLNKLKLFLLLKQK